MTTVKRGFQIKTDNGKIRIGKNATVVQNSDGSKTYTTRKGNVLTKSVSAVKADGSAAARKRVGPSATKTSSLNDAGTMRTNVLTGKGGKVVTKTWTWATPGTPPGSNGN